MKRIICLLTALCLVLGSFSFAFAQDWSATDSNNLANIRASVMSGGQLYNAVNACNTVLNNINYNIVTLMGWLDPSNGGGTTALLNQILNALVYTNAGGVVTSWLVDIQGYNYQTAERLLDIKNVIQGTRNYSNVLFNSPGQNGTVNSQRLDMSSWNMGDRIFTYLSNLSNSTMSIYSLEYAQRVNGYNTQQSLVSFADPDSTVTFTPLSATDGIYKYLNAINTPLARLGYVLASDSRIEAQEAAAANEQAVVDNFIDSSGGGSASPSDIGSVSDLSSGFSSNISTDADPGDIFDIFDSNNFSWFSQEIADSLDTTNSNNRSKSGSEFDTPLLDQRIDDIYNALGVKHD